MARDFYLERPERCEFVIQHPSYGPEIRCNFREGHSGGHDFTAPQPNVANGDGDLKGITLLALIAIAVLVGVLAAGCLGWLS